MGDDTLATEGRGALGRRIDEAGLLPGLESLWGILDSPFTFSPFSAAVWVMQDADIDVTTGDGGRARAVSETTDVERVYREQGARLWRALLAYAGDREEANDAVAEAFAQMLRRGRDVRDPTAWVWRAAFRIAAGEMKARQRRGRSGFSASVETGDGPSDRLVAAMRELSPKQRGSVLLHHYAGHSVREVAAILGSTSAAVRVHLSQGRKRLRVLLEDDHDD